MKTQLAVLLAAGLLATPALADDIFVTQDPGGFFGYIGFDVFPGQSVAARFIVQPGADYTFNHVGIWFMSNDFDGTTPQTVTVTLRTNVNPGGDFDSAPSGVILETWTRNITAIGWTPVLEGFDSEAHPRLYAGAMYWFVAESNVAAGVNPIWVWSAEGNEFTGTNEGTSWQTGFGAAIGIRVQGTPIHYCTVDFNCDGDVGTDSDIADFFACLAGSCPALPCRNTADFNGDGDTGTDADIEAFFRVLGGGNC